MRTRISLLAALVPAPSLAVATDPLDCNDMAPVVSEMLADRMRIPEYLLLDSATAADTTFRMNYYHAERREYQRTVCSVIVRFNPIRFADAERQAARMDSSRALERLAKAASVGGLALLADVPSGLKVGYRLELLGNGGTWVVTLLGDPVIDPICALPDRHQYLADERLCSSTLGERPQWRRTGAVDPPSPGVDR